MQLRSKGTVAASCLGLEFNFTLLSICLWHCAIGLYADRPNHRHFLTQVPSCMALVKHGETWKAGVVSFAHLAQDWQGTDLARR